MKTLRRLSALVLVCAFLTACAAQASAAPSALSFDNPYAPQPGDSAMMRGELRIDSASVGVHGSDVTLNFGYFQPTPCYQLRVEATGTDAGGRIDVSAYAVAEKDKPCALMALATPLQASLDLGSLPSGHYSVWLNEVKVGEIDT